MAPWADVLYGCDYSWWDVCQGVPKFAGLKITQDGPKCARKYPQIRPIVCDRKTDNLLTAKLGVVGWGGNSGFHALNLAAQFGVSKIILVGYDLNSVDHWHGKHGKGLNNPTVPNVARWCKAIDNAAPVLKSLGIQVFNTSPVSKLANYPKMSLQEALDCAP